MRWSWVGGLYGLITVLMITSAFGQPAFFGVCGDPATRIHAVQGSGKQSPLIGQSVVVEGVVVGDMQGVAPALQGFYLQEEAAHADTAPTTSEGLFVSDRDRDTDVEPGDVVRVRGKVAELRGNLTQLRNATHLVVCSQGQSVPPVPLTLPVSRAADWERFEGMLVSFAQELIVIENFRLAQFGEFMVAPSRLFAPTLHASPGPDAKAIEVANSRSRLVVDDARFGENLDPIAYPTGGLTANRTLTNGDTIRGLTGILDHRHGSYRLQPTVPITFQSRNTRPSTPSSVGGTLKVASFNVLNFFTTLDNGSPMCGPSNRLDCRGADNGLEFTRQRDKIFRALHIMDADIVGLIELENNARAAVGELINGVNQLGAPGTYQFIDTGTIGADAIKVALIYKAAVVEPVGAFAVLDQSVNPHFLDRKNRPALAQTFRHPASGGVLTISVNHFKSKGSPCTDVGDRNQDDGQGNCNGTRTKAAHALATWLAGDPTGSSDPDVLIIGDLNAYTKEDPLVTLTSAGYIDLVEAFVPPEQAYSYGFQGAFGYLDHALASATLRAQVSGVTIWHINADEPVALDYNTEGKSAGQITLLFAPSPFRSSDHDPVIVGLNLRGP